MKPILKCAFSGGRTSAYMTKYVLDNFSDEIKNDKELVIIAVSPDNGGAPAYRYASDELQKDPDVIAATKKGNLADGWDEDQGIYL